MGRNEKNDVDYFPFYCKEGKTMHVIETKFRNDGFAVWVKLLRQLATTDFHYLDLRDELDVIYLSSRCLVEQEVLIGVLDILAKFNEIDGELWTKHRIVWNQKFVDSINDAYNKRRNKPLFRQSLIDKLNLNDGVKAVKQDINTQSKVKESKEDKSKVNIDTVVPPFFSAEFLEVWNLLLTENKHFKKKTAKQLQRIADDLKKHSEQEAIEAIVETFKGGWMAIHFKEKRKPIINPNQSKGMFEAAEELRRSLEEF